MNAQIITASMLLKIITEKPRSLLRAVDNVLGLEFYSITFNCSGILLQGDMRANTIATINQIRTSLPETNSSPFTTNEQGFLNLMLYIPQNEGASAVPIDITLT